jgi:hypothetical protein
MIRSPRPVTLVALVATALIGGLVGAVVGGRALPGAIAQGTPTPTPRPGFVNTVSYAATYLNQVAPTESGVKVLEVIPFPTSPVFIVRTDKHVNIWERRGSSLRNLLEIRINDVYKGLHVLDDGRTIIIHTEKAASIYSIEPRITEVPAPTSRR